MIWALYPNRKDDVKRKTTQFDIFIKNFFCKTRSVDYACETSNCHTFCPTIRPQNLPHLLSISKTKNNRKLSARTVCSLWCNFSFTTTCSLTVYFAIACFFQRASACALRAKKAHCKRFLKNLLFRKNFPNKMLDNFSFENYIIIFDNKG